MKYYLNYHPADPASPEISFEEWCDMQEEEAENEYEERLINNDQN